MKTSCLRIVRRSQQGTAALELALLMPIFMSLLAFPLFIGRVMWYYDASQKAASDAARFLATASQVELRTPGPGGTEAAVATLTRQIARAATADLVLGEDYPVRVAVQCNMVDCGAATLPPTVRVVVSVDMTDGIFGEMTSSMFEYGVLSFTADVTMRYVPR
ncbi:MAG: TadE/TadG family type IV pilus assembly protein [Telluria sp.]